MEPWAGLRWAEIVPGSCYCVGIIPRRSARPRIADDGLAPFLDWSSLAVFCDEPQKRVGELRGVQVRFLAEGMQNLPVWACSGILKRLRDLNAGRLIAMTAAGLPARLTRTGRGPARPPHLFAYGRPGTINGAATRSRGTGQRRRARCAPRSRDLLQPSLLRRLRSRSWSLIPWTFSESPVSNDWPRDPWLRLHFHPRPTHP